MKILFTRHGESEANVLQIISNRGLPHKLTAVGIAQAMGLAESLVKWNVKSVIASPVTRAKETGSIIAEALGAALIISPALREFDCGMMEGRGDDEAWRAHQALTRAWDEDQDYDARIEPDGESFNDMKARFLPFMAKIMEEKNHDDGDMLLISHGGMLHQMLLLVLTNVERRFTKQHPLGNCELVVTQIRDEDLICIEWARMKLV